MKDARSEACVNLYGVLGALEVLCRIDEVAKRILGDLKKPIAICFDIKGGPTATLRFTQEGCTFSEGRANETCRMVFSTPEKFNRMINEGKPGLPAKNPIGTLAFLAGPFTKLTDRLSELLRPSEEAMRDRAFFEENTILTLYVVAGAVSALANTDPISRISASNTPDGEISLGIADVAYASIRVSNGHFETIRAAAESPRAIMEFADVDLANGLFAGTVSSIGEVCRGRIRLAGMLSMVDNVNRILDRVAVYLA